MFSTRGSEKGFEYKQDKKFEKAKQQYKSWEYINDHAKGTVFNSKFTRKMAKNY